MSQTAANSFDQTSNASARTEEILAWYDRHRRHLPWRAAPGEVPDPYHVWLSEIMLQQTTVVTVGPYFERFLARWPTVEALGEAPLEEVLSEWAGLGYYARARNLHACAREVAEQLGGRFPETEAELLKLPGIGPYTAAAIAAIAFNQRAAVLDGNVERVMARLFAVTDPLPSSKEHLRAVTFELTPNKRPGDYAQAVMDLGATICTPRKPKCLACPWNRVCQSVGTPLAEELPRKLKKPKKPTRRGVAFFVTNNSGAILLRRRPAKGLLGGMHEVPSTDWVEGEVKSITPPFSADWRKTDATVRHTFTHFQLELGVWTARVSSDTQPVEGEWWSFDEIGNAALPTIMVKIIEAASLAASIELGGLGHELEAIRNIGREFGTEISFIPTEQK